MPTFELGNIAGLVKSETVPLNPDETVKKHVVWAKILNPAEPNKVVLMIYDFDIADDWVPLYNKASSIVLGSVISFLSDPPANPGEGDSYIINETASGVWVGHEEQIAEYKTGAWVYTTPIRNGYALVVNEQTFYVYGGGAYPNGTWATALAGNVAPYDGNRAIKRVPTVGLNVGGATTKEFLDNLYFPYLQPTVPLNLFSLQQVGANLIPNIKGTIALNDEEGGIDEIRIIDVTTETTLETIVDPAIVNPGEYLVDYNAPQVAIIKGEVNKYKIEADFPNNGTPLTKESPERIVEGVFPYLVGMSSVNLGPTDIFPTLSKYIERQGDKELMLQGEVKPIYFGYDEDYPDLVSIKDPNGFEIINIFTKLIIAVQSSGLPNNYTKNFKVYKSGVTTANGLYKFLY